MRTGRPSLLAAAALAVVTDRRRLLLRPGRRRQTSPRRRRGARPRRRRATAAPRRRPLHVPTRKYPKRQLRGVWIATVRQHRLALRDRPVRRARSRPSTAAGSTWPSSADLNAVFVQVRPDRRRVLGRRRTSRGRSTSPARRARTRAGTRWPSWSPRRTSADLEFHAWFNPYRAAYDGRRWPSCPPTTPARQHPDWIVKLRAAGSTTTPACPRSATSSPRRRSWTSVQQLRHRRRALRRLLLPLPGRRRGRSPTTPPSRSTARVRRSWPTGGATTSTCWSPQVDEAVSRRPSRG